MRHVRQRVYLLRHGETEWSLNGRHTGTTDLALTGNGRAVAKRLARVLGKERFEMVLTSPLQRARQTCELAGLAARAATDADLLEWNYGEYEGETLQQIRDKAPEWLIFRDGCPGGENPAQIGARVDRLIAKVRAVNGNVALFGHGHVLRVLVARWLALPVAGGSHFLLGTATLSVLGYYHGIGAVECWNLPLAS